MKPPSDYYEANAEAYVKETLGVGMNALYGPFLALVPPGGHILDAGCGSGRDAREFKRLAYRVTALDASAEVARLAAKVLGHPVEIRRLQDVADEVTFDGVWACASLLHVPRSEIDDVFARLTRALRPGGVWYMSFKLGESEEVRNGRLFSDYTEESLHTLLAWHSSLETVSLWRTNDQRPERSNELWLNALVQKR